MFIWRWRDSRVTASMYSMILIFSRPPSVQSSTDSLKLAGMWKQGKEGTKGRQGYEVTVCLNV
jgi:hypothetical protein